MRYLQDLFGRFSFIRKQAVSDGSDISERIAQTEKLKISGSLKNNLQKIEQVTGKSADIIIRPFKAAGDIPVAIVYIEGMVQNEDISNIIRAITTDIFKSGIPIPRNAKVLYQEATETLLPIRDYEEVDCLNKLFLEIASGNTALLIDTQDKAILCDTKNLKIRNIDEPESETVIRGPRDSFIENIRINTSMLRRRIRVPQLWVESLEIGALTQTQVAIVYIKGLAKNELIEEVRNRLQKIDIDAVLESGYLEEFIGNTPFTFFPQVRRTERPDIVAGDILEGKIAILTDGTPFVLIVPATINSMLQATDDYYEKTPLGSALRLLRLSAFFISVLLPGTYVAIINFHHELLATTLLLQITSTREGPPFPLVFEALLMEGLFEMLREAGVRLPRAIGQAISIVGALILGEAAINAGLVSPAMVVIVAVTAIASFTVPAFGLGIAGRLLRFVFICLGAIFGLFGIQFGLLLLIIHLCSLHSFGTPILSPYAPLVFQDLKDSFIRTWWWKMDTRPELSGKREPRRQNKKQMPRPENTKKERGRS